MLVLVLVVPVAAVVVVAVAGSCSSYNGSGSGCSVSSTRIFHIPSVVPGAELLEVGFFLFCMRYEFGIAGSCLQPQRPIAHFEKLVWSTNAPPTSQ